MMSTIFIFLVLVISALIFAFIRGMHDSYLREGKWKKWSSAQTVYTSFILSFLLSSSLSIWMIPVMMLVYFVTFSIAFDCWIGYKFGGSILYVGNTGYDKKIRKIFHYNEKYKGLLYLTVKLIGAAVIFATYFYTTKVF